MDAVEPARQVPMLVLGESMLGSRAVLGLGHRYVSIPVRSESGPTE
jgi:hypothetical protein